MHDNKAQQRIQGCPDAQTPPTHVKTSQKKIWPPHGAASFASHRPTSDQFLVPLLRSLSSAGRKTRLYILSISVMCPCHHFCIIHVTIIFLHLKLNGLFVKLKLCSKFKADYCSYLQVHVMPGHSAVKVPRSFL